MITHKKNSVISFLFSKLAERQIRKQFRRVSLTKRSVIPELSQNVPTIVILNHSSWWDAMVCLYLSRVLFKREDYGVFAEEQLKRYGIFRYIGCFSVNRTSTKDFKHFLKYTIELLDQKSRMLWIFPQGELVSNDLRPFDFKKGFAVIASKLQRVQILKLAISYDFWIDSRPEVVIDVISSETFSGSEIDPETYAAECGFEVGTSVAYLKELVIHRKYDALNPLFETNHGTNPIYDAWRRVASLCRREKFISTHGENLKK